MIGLVPAPRGRVEPGAVMGLIGRLQLSISGLMRGLLGGVLAAALAVAAPAAAQDLNKLKFTMSFTIDGSSATYIYAKQAGLYKKAGYDVQIDPSAGSGDAINRVA